MPLPAILSGRLAVLLTAALELRLWLVPELCQDNLAGWFFRMPFFASSLSFRLWWALRMPWAFLEGGGQAASAAV